LPPNLTQLANALGSDKGDAVGNAHNFTALYAFLFEGWRNDHFHLLELGLQRGDGNPMVYLDSDRKVSDAPSIRVWLEYFPNARCIGFDSADFTHITIPRFEFIRGNLSRICDLERLAASVPLLRFVVDDASHASYHQQLAFVTLFKRIESNGFYIIEDLDYQPPYETELPACLKTADVFERFTVHRDLVLAGASEETAREIAGQIRNVFIHRNRSSGSAAGSVKLVAVQKS
jgi:hypothetical protein